MEKETIEHKGIEIEIYVDEYPLNPYEDWDVCLPLMTKSGSSNFKDYSNGSISYYLRNLPSDGQIIRHQKYLAELFEDIDLEDMKNREFSVRDRVNDIRLWIGESRNFDALEKFCNLFKIPCYNTCSRGYSQGDYADLFLCYTSKFTEITGLKQKEVTEEEFESAKELWAAWAWGDVFGYKIPEIGENCGGYYGDDHEKSGLLEEAKAQIDYYIEAKRKEKQDKLKELVRNHVPLEKRTQILSTI